MYDNFLHGHMENVEKIRDRIHVVFGDVLNEWQLSESFRTHRPDYVFNFVGDTYVPTAYDMPKRFFNINVEGNLNVLMACKMFDVKRVLYVSSTEVYGEAQVTPMDESHPLSPLNTYAVSKLASDRLCFTFNVEHDIPVIIARIFNSYGPRETEPYVIPEIITQLDKGPVVYLGNLDAERDFTYVSDTATRPHRRTVLRPTQRPTRQCGDRVRSTVCGSSPIVSVVSWEHEQIEIRIDERRAAPYRHRTVQVRSDTTAGGDRMGADRRTGRRFEDDRRLVPEPRSSLDLGGPGRRHHPHRHMTPMPGAQEARATTQAA